MATRRSLSRIKKDVVFLRQLGQCAYCLAPMDDAFEVDHMNECCEDDRWANLVASCGTCHNTKSRAYRLRAKDPAKAALLRRMLEEAAQHRAELLREYLLCADTPSDAPLTPRLPRGCARACRRRRCTSWTPCAARPRGGPRRAARTVAEVRQALAR